LVRYICWSGTYVGPVHMLVRYICWSGTYVGPVHMLVRYICWSGTYVGPVHMLVRYICWSGTYVGPVHMLVWYICWSGTSVHIGPHTLGHDGPCVGLQREQLVPMHQNGSRQLRHVSNNPRYHGYEEHFPLEETSRCSGWPTADYDSICVADIAESLTAVFLSRNPHLEVSPT
jgi:hypothetical protein